MATTDGSAEPRSPWADPRFRLFATGNIINNIGEAMYDLTLPLLVYDLTGSLVVMTALAAMVPATLLLGPVLGAVADRWGSRVMVMPGLLVQFTAALAINTVAVSADHTNWVLLFGFGALVQIGGAMYRVGWMTGVPTMFPQCPVRARGVLGSLFVASTFIGPLIVAAALPLGYRNLLWINLGTFLAPMVVWWLGVKPPWTAQPRDRRFDLAGSLRIGWTTVWRERRLVGAVLTMLPLEFVGATSTTTLMIFYLRGSFRLSASAVSGAVVAMNLAAFLGSVVISQRARFPVRPTLAVVTVGMVACLFLIAVPHLPVVLAALTLFFALTGAAGVASSMLIVAYVPTDVMGRAFGILRLIWAVPAIAAPATVPLVAGWSGVRATFVGLGLVASLAVAILAAMWRRWSEPVVERPTQRAAAPVPVTNLEA